MEEERRSTRSFITRSFVASPTRIGGATSNNQEWGKGSSHARGGITKEKRWGKNADQSQKFNALLRITQEVVDTENTYVNALDTLMERYAQPLRRRANELGLKEQAVERLFVNVDPIASFHRVSEGRLCFEMGSLTVYFICDFH